MKKVLLFILLSLLPLLVSAINPNPTEVVVYALERDYTNDEKIGGTGQPWDNQFYIVANRTIAAGEVTVIQFKYRAARAAKASTLCYSESGTYLHWAAIGDVNFTEDWQDFETTFTIPAEANGMKTIAFNLSEIMDANEYYIKDVVWKIKDGTESLINQTGSDNFFVKEGANDDIHEFVPYNGESWTLAGDNALLGSDWDITDNTNDMRTKDNGINFTKTKSNVTLERGTYEFRVTKNHSWDVAYPADKAYLVIEETATYKITFTFNTETHQLSATATKTDGLFFNYIEKGKVAELIQNPNKYKGDFVIPATIVHEGQEYTVTKIADGAFYNCDKLTSVTIPNSVTSIGNSAFLWCDGLTNITIPNSVTSIGTDAFSGCSKLTSVTIPNNVTSISENTFIGCSGLTSVNIGNSVTSIGVQAFRDCRKLNSVTIPNSVTSICAGAFQDCSSLTSVTIPNSVTLIGHYAFSGCTGLTSVIIPNSLTSIGSCVFQNCSGLTSVTIPNNLTSIGDGAFSGCSGLTSVSIPNSLTSIGSSVFSDCSGLTSVTIPNSVTSIGVSAFWNCSGLTSVTIGGGVKYIGEQAFGRCEKLTDVYCLVEKIRGEYWSGEGLYTTTEAFNNSYIEYASLHVPAASINAFRSTVPWSLFKAIVALEGGDTPTIQKCATPVISYANGKIDFTCETEGVEFVSEVIVEDAKKYYDASVTLSQTYKVTVYATKAGYENSDVATREIVIGNGQSSLFGDLNKDGKVNVADHVKLSDIIMNK